ncbi:MAG: hypothetical protein ACD_28C00224G0003 [uncultured bacterium]|nr:MAG: hypothetical protein ACD_28C00224G0003 [uncultured bacterium]KKT75705.1 MAG: hypothetical protein UW70_C0030G0024 [Candidatus Peregrinibacteria bacterium GW2011_GWA2_44_7]
MSHSSQDLDTPSFHWAHFIAFAATGIVLAGMAWTYFQHYRLEAQLDEVQAQTRASQEQLVELQSKKLDALIVAQEKVMKVNQESIQWSKVVATLLKVTPPNIFYSSYSASSEGRMALSVVTDAYDSAANLIALLDKHNLFSEVFSSSLNRGLSESNQSLVTFGVTFKVQ